jgi:O-acetyl-ADP-ribose deacetylase (regulator of RNase III)
MRSEFPAGRVLALERGDITLFEADGIVNAANARLAGGGGVDGAIHRAGGPGLMRELDVIRARQGGCPTGSAVATSAGKLKARYVFHAVGPIYRGGESGEAGQLASCYRTCLEMAEERGLKTLAFPSISTGVYGYPVSEAAWVALGVVAEHLKRERTGLRTVTFVLFDEHTLAVYGKALKELSSRAVGG